MKLRVFGLIIVTIALLTMLPGAARAAPQVFIKTDSESYKAGDTVEVSLAGHNDGGGMSVDVYVGLLTPEGALYTLAWDGWCEGVKGPWAPGFWFPRLAQPQRTPFFWFTVPCEMPPINEPGEFFFLAALTRADTADLLSNIALAAFMVGMPQASDYYVDVEIGDDANYGSEEAPWQSIRHALYSVESLQEAPVAIHVAPGTYFWATGEAFPLRMKSWVSLVAEGPGTTIDAEEYGTSVIACEDVQGVTIRGFTITGGGPASYGGLMGVKFGGGIFCRDSSVLIADNTIRENSAGWGACGGGGAGIYCTGGSPAIVGNLILRNTAEPSCAAEGGGILCENSAAIIANNTIVGNTACFGGGIATWDYQNAGPPQIFNNTIVDNIGYGSGISCSGVDAAVVDCIVWGTNDLVLYGVSASYCCIKGGYPGEGNIDQDPMLVADSPWPGWTGWKRYLDPASPCIDAGSRSAEEAGLSRMTTQEDGTPDTGRVDMGVHYPIP
ncbi:MAG TPA: DUF1565 domain-containing protein [bacterium]|nr:DUF1565 domain-containing protein [bacterium]